MGVSTSWRFTTWLICIYIEYWNPFNNMVDLYIHWILRPVSYESKTFRFFSRWLGQEVLTFRNSKTIQSSLDCDSYSTVTSSRNFMGSSFSCISQNRPSSPKTLSSTVESPEIRPTLNKGSNILPDSISDKVFSKECGEESINKESRTEQKPQHSDDSSSTSHSIDPSVTESSQAFPTSLSPPSDPFANFCTNTNEAKDPCAAQWMLVGEEQTTKLCFASMFSCLHL